MFFRKKEEIKMDFNWKNLDLNVKDNIDSPIVHQIFDTLKNLNSDKILFVVGDRGSGKSSVISSALKMWANNKPKSKKSVIKINAWKVFRDIDGSDISRKDIRKHLINRIVRVAEEHENDFTDSKRFRKKIYRDINWNTNRGKLNVVKWTSIIFMLSLMFMMVFMKEKIYSVLPSADVFAYIAQATAAFVAIISNGALSNQEIDENKALDDLSSRTTNDHLIEKLINKHKIIIHIEDIDRIQKINIQKNVVEEVMHLYGIKGIEVVVELLPITINNIMDSLSSDDNHNKNEWKTKYAGNVFYVTKLSQGKKIQMIKKSLSIEDESIDYILNMCTSLDKWNIREIFDNYNAIASHADRYIKGGEWENTKLVFTEIAVITLIRKHFHPLYEIISERFAYIKLSNLMDIKEELSEEELKIHSDSINEIEELLYHVKIDNLEHIPIGNYISYVETEVDRDTMFLDTFIKQKGKFWPEDTATSKTLKLKLKRKFNDLVDQDMHQQAKDIVIYLLTLNMNPFNTLEKESINKLDLNGSFWKKFLKELPDANKESEMFLSGLYTTKITGEDQKIIHHTDLEVLISIIKSPYNSIIMQQRNLNYKVMDKLNESQIKIFTDSVPVELIFPDISKEIMYWNNIESFSKYVTGKVSSTDLTNVFKIRSFATVFSKNKHNKDTIIKSLNALGDKYIKEDSDEYDQEEYIKLIKFIIKKHGMIRLSINASKDTISDNFDGIRPVFKLKEEFQNDLAFEMYEKGEYDITDFSSIDLKKIKSTDSKVILSHYVLDSDIESISDDVWRDLFKNHQNITTTYDLLEFVKGRSTPACYTQFIRRLVWTIKDKSSKKMIKNHDVAIKVRGEDHDLYNKITKKRKSKRLKK